MVFLFSVLEVSFFFFLKGMMYDGCGMTNTCARRCEIPGGNVAWRVHEIFNVRYPSVLLTGTCTVYNIAINLKIYTNLRSPSSLYSGASFTSCCESHQSQPMRL
jgi:hypothetical protein